MEKTAKHNSVTNSIMNISVCNIYDNLICLSLQKIWLLCLKTKMHVTLWRVNIYAKSIFCLPTLKLSQLQKLSFIVPYRHRECLCTRNGDVHKN